MSIQIFNSISDLNNNLENISSTLGENGIETDKKTLTLSNIHQILVNNQKLLNTPDSLETVRFLKVAKQLNTVLKDEDKGEGHLKTAMKTASHAFERLGKENVGESVHVIQNIKSIDEKLYKKTLANWVNQQEIPLKKLGLSNDELLELAPWLTYVDLTDGEVFVVNYEKQLRNCTFTDDFAGKLLENTHNINSLLIKNSIINGSALVKIPKINSLKKLEIDFCPNFNQSLPESLNQCTHFKMSGCEAFNQSLPKSLNQCTHFEMSVCRAFNQSLPESLNQCTHFKMSRCRAFNQSLPESLNQCTHFEMSVCRAFNQSLPKSLNQCTHFEMIGCEAFNQSLPKSLNQCTHFKMSVCPAFNQSLPESLNQCTHFEMIGCNAFNQSLPKSLNQCTHFKMSDCPAFNQSLPESLNQCTHFKMSHCYAFNPFDHTIKTAISLALDPDFFHSKWKTLSNDKKTQKQVQFLNENEYIEELTKTSLSKLINLLNTFEIEMDLFLGLYPEHLEIKAELALTKVEYLLKRGQSHDVIEEMIAALRDQKNYLDYLKVMITSFPALTTFFVKRGREEFAKDLESIKIPIKSLPLEAKLSLLPLLSPEDIQKTIGEVSSEEQSSWLQEQMSYDHYSGSIIDVLSQIKSLNIDQRSDEEMEHTRFLLEESLEKIPLKTFAALASLEKTAPVALSFLPIMTEQQVAVAVPMLSSDHLLKFLKERRLVNHTDFLAHATASQKGKYLDEDLLTLESLEKWKTENKPSINSKIGGFKSDPTDKKFLQLQLDWNKIFSETNRSIEISEYLLKRLDRVMHLFDHAEQFDEKVKKYIVQKREKAASVSTELKEKAKEIEGLSQLVPDYKETPEEFIDNITGEIMENPMKDRHGNVLDQSTWDSTGSNPYTRESLVESKLELDTELQKKIQEFIK